MKKLIPWVALVMMLAFVGSMPALATETTIGASDGKEVTIVWWTNVANPQTQTPEWYLSAQAFMKENPNIKVDIQGAPDGTIESKVMLAAQANELPDIFHCTRPLSYELEKQGLLADITAESAARGISERFLPGMLEYYGENNDVVHGYPCSAHVPFFFYNKAILEKHDLQLPKTFDELLVLVGRLKELGYTPFAQGNLSNFSTWNYYEFLYRFGFEEKFAGLMDGSISWVNEDFVKAFTHLAELRDAGAFPANMATIDYYQALDLFTSGQAVFVDSGVWQGSTMAAANMGDKIGYWFGPEFTDGVGPQNVTGRLGGHPFCVSAKTAQDPVKLDATMKLLDFFYGPKGAAITIENSNVPTVRYDGETDAVVKVLLSAMADESWISKTPLDQTLPAGGDSIIWQATVGLLADAYTPEEALQQIETELSFLINR